jgi:hypothetical protein
MGVENGLTVVLLPNQKYHLVRMGRKEVYDEFQLWHAEVPGGSNRTVCGLRRHLYIVCFNFWESSLLDLRLGKLDARADDCEYKRIIFD